MMSEIKFFYAENNNMGDMINPLIVKKVFNINTKCSPTVKADLFGIGSGLDGIFESKIMKKKIIQRAYSLKYKKVHVWGTGFMNNYNENDFGSIYRSQTIIHAVRGELSRKKIEKFTGKKLNVPTGDGGILANQLLPEIPQKKYNVGIIPHMSEFDSPLINKIYEYYNNSCIINLKKDPIEVINQIAECEIILSSSLHGLIVADSFNIPNIHVYITDKIYGDGFKFKDYYSNYGIIDMPLNLNNNNYPTEQEIKDNYRVSVDQVDRMKKNMILSFPFPAILN